MKRLILSVVAMAVAVMAFAGRPTGLVVGGGYLLDSYNVSTPYQYHYEDQSIYNGAYVEIGYDLKCDKHIDIVLSARYSTAFNTNVPSSSSIISGDDITMINYLNVRSYLEIPLKFQFSWNLSPALKIFFDLGPTYNLWLTNGTLCNKYKKVAGVEEKMSSVTNWFKDTPNLYQRNNVALGGDFGFILHNVKMFVGYDHNMLSFTQKNYYRSSGRTDFIRIGACYIF